MSVESGEDMEYKSLKIKCCWCDEVSTYEEPGKLGIVNIISLYCGNCGTEHATHEILEVVL